MRLTRIKHGVYGGLAGGRRVRRPNGDDGDAPHDREHGRKPFGVDRVLRPPAISATIGGSFAVLLDARKQRGGVGSGLAYGFAWWVLDP